VVRPTDCMILLTPSTSQRGPPNPTSWLTTYGSSSSSLARINTRTGLTSSRGNVAIFHARNRAVTEIYGAVAAVVDVFVLRTHTSCGSGLGKTHLTGVSGWTCRLRSLHGRPGWPQWEHGFRPGRPSKPVLEGQSIKDSFDKDSVDGKQAEADPCRQGALRCSVRPDQALKVEVLTASVSETQLSPQPSSVPVVSGHRGHGRPGEVVVQHLSEPVVDGEADIDQCSIEAGDPSTVHLLMRTVAAIHPHNRGLVAVAVLTSLSHRATPPSRRRAAGCARDGTRD
jgi:hypothetical protein